MAGLQLLIDLAPTLTNLQSLKWSYWITQPSVLPLLVKGLDLLGSVPGLKELIIEIAVSDPSPGFTFKPFSNLSSVSVHWIHEGNITQDFSAGLVDLLGRCPNLEKFTFSVPRPYHPSKVPSFTHIFSGIGSLPSTTCLKLRHLDLTGIYVSADEFRVHLHHLRSLKILRLMFNRCADSPGENDQICGLLLDNSIYLDEFAIDTTHPPNVLKYLSSYSGLEHLKFQSRYPGADSPENIHRFFSLVLPLHRATLRVLHLGWSVETLWTRDIPPEELAQIEKCQQLTRISCYITVAVGRTGRTDKLMGRWLETTMKLARLQHFWFYPTCLIQPRLHTGHYYYDDEEEFGLEMEVKKFAVNKVEKFKAEYAVPFVMKASSAPSLGP
ncbi:hypothetical protein Agabi119p4_1110 [Agaricus bisporus var. burnettii]|uniref:F-box domain-containing protein n=1 Tax=Agaricus bisporus var. burnettii TaxID=192524 RepID=A0A8H7KLD5_AGABI|nr:hypothetical protein Agabi119p4_1110 [Agaricus bisporus var. burnettii]